MQSNHPPHTTAPESLPALLVYLDDLASGMAYVLAEDHAGRWRFAAFFAAELPNLTREALTQPVPVDAAGDLRQLPYPSVSTIVTTTEGAAS